MGYDRKDHFYRRAKREGKASRAVYKLSELQKRFHLVRHGNTVIDLGCAPGGWMQELSAMVGPKGCVIGIDLLPIKILRAANCHFIKGDVEDASNINEILRLAGGKADTVLSDMSPNLSGIAFADAYRSYELCMRALDLCKILLKPNGNFVVKIFPGDELANFISELKKQFDKVDVVIPEATRKTSSERYIVARGFKKN